MRSEVGAICPRDRDDLPLPVVFFFVVVVEWLALGALLGGFAVEGFGPVCAEIPAHRNRQRPPAIRKPPAAFAFVLSVPARLRLAGSDYWSVAGTTPASNRVRTPPPCKSARMVLNTTSCPGLSAAITLR